MRPPPRRRPRRRPAPPRQQPWRPGGSWPPRAAPAARTSAARWTSRPGWPCPWRSLQGGGGRGGWWYLEREASNRGCSRQLCCAALRCARQAGSKCTNTAFRRESQQSLRAPVRSTCASIRPRRCASPAAVCTRWMATISELTREGKSPGRGRKGRGAEVGAGEPSDRSEGAGGWHIAARACHHAAPCISTGKQGLPN